MDSRGGSAGRHVGGWIAFTQPGTQPLAILLAALGISLAMIGPGAWSIDARLYGESRFFHRSLEARLGRCDAG